jgi:hypothetical protein
MSHAPASDGVWRARAGLALLWLALLAMAVAVYAAGGGSTGFPVGPLRVSIRNPTNPTLIALAAGLTGLRLFGWRRSEVHAERIDRAVAAVAPLLTTALAAFVLAGTLVAGARIAGGADSSGYLSEARLWRGPSLHQRPALAGTIPLAHPTQAFIPIGFRLSPSGNDMVPVYPPGYPLMMAAAAAAFGDGAEFLIVPFCAAGVVLLTAAIGRRLGGPHVGLLAGAAAAVSPMLLVQAMQPMSDVPATFWWTLAFLLLTFDSIPAAAAAGLAACAASLVRPNLFAMVPVAAALALAWEDTWSRGLKRASAFVIPTVPVAAAFALWQASTYGSTSESGYGGISSLFSVSHVLPNLGRYPAWLIDTHSPLVLVSLAAPPLIARGRAAPLMSVSRSTRVAWGALTMLAALGAFYALYLVFDTWAYLRFLLPALPPVLALMVLAPLALLRRWVGPWRGLLVIALLLVVTTWGFSRSRGVGALLVAAAEQRYVDVADFARAAESSAVFATMQHSGSLHYYTARPILRWDWTEPQEIDRAVAQLGDAGHAVYVVLDDWEEPGFRTRFAGTRLLSSLDRPVYQTTSPGIFTSVYRVHVK